MVLRLSIVHGLDLKAADEARSSFLRVGIAINVFLFFVSVDGKDDDFRICVFYSLCSEALAGILSSIFNRTLIASTHQHLKDKS